MSSPTHYVPGVGMIPSASAHNSSSGGKFIHVPGIGMVPDPASGSSNPLTFLHIPGIGKVPTSSCYDRPIRNLPPPGFSSTLSSTSFQGDDDMSSLDDSFCSTTSFSSIGSHVSTSSSVVAGIGEVPLGSSGAAAMKATTSLPSVRSWSRRSHHQLTPRASLNNAFFLQRTEHRRAERSSSRPTMATGRLLAALGSSAPCDERAMCRKGRTRRHNNNEPVKEIRRHSHQRRFHSNCSLQSLKHVPSMQTVHE